MRFLVFLAAAFLPPMAQAACEGTDMSLDWDPGMRDEIVSRAEAVPFPEGRFWEVSRDGKTSVLFGTVHLADDDVAEPPAALVDRLKTAEELLIEVTRAEEQRLMRGIVLNPKRFLNISGPRLSETLDPETWEEVARLAEPYGIPPEAADRVMPWYLAITLSTPACVLSYMGTGKQILDRRIESMATDMGVVVTGLEKPEDVFNLFEAMPFERQVDMLRMSLPTALYAEDYLETTKQLYKRGQIQQILAFGMVLTEREFGVEETAQAAALFFDTLLTTRNKRWMDELVPRLDQGDRVIAVGALHLGGDEGLLTLLQDEGFQVRRLDD